ncbi:MAG: hypothetical protein RR439_05805 [Carnobacterium sp.]
METCEVFFSNGYSINVNISQHAFVELISCEDGLLNNRLVLLENIKGNPLYINPLQIISVKALFNEAKEKDAAIKKTSENTERESHNIEAVKNLNEEVKNTE